MRAAPPDLSRPPSFPSALPHSSQEEVQHALLPHRDVGGVGKVYEPPQHLGADVAQRDLGGRTLPEAAGEHGSEVRAAGGQDHLVHLWRQAEDVLSVRPVSAGV